MVAFQQIGPAAEILNVLHLAVLLVDRHRRIRYRNATAATWLPDARGIDEIFADARFFDPFDWNHAITGVLDVGAIFRADCAFKLASTGATVLATVRGAPLRDADRERVDGVVVVVEERLAQEPSAEQLEVSKRLTSLGKLASRVAHELNNPLDGILRYVNLALRLVDQSPDPKLKSYLSESRAGLMRMIQIVGDLLEFSRVGDGLFEAASVNDVIEQAIKAVVAQAEAANVMISADFQTQQMPQTSGSRLYQVCLNLLKNAIEAMPAGGRLSVTSGQLANDVVIRIEDTGTGLPIPPEKVFEPFFTTKPPGKGTGLGLAICKDFVEDMHGSITAANGAERGAVFTVRIPLAGFAAPKRFSAGSSLRSKQE
jgi:signal transduction histidine kinase